jgi:large subunit ribosomal protein L9
MAAVGLTTEFLGQAVHKQRCSALRSQSAAVPAPARAPFRVCAQKKVVKRQQVILLKDIPGTGSKGELARVNNGYLRNYLMPQQLAVPATAGILQQIQKKDESEQRAAMEVKSKAQAMATALATIGKFVIRKKVGEKDQIFGSVSTADIVEAIELQTGRQLDKKNVELPDIKTLGTYDATVKLHPEVIGKFKIVVQKLKEQGK